MSPKRILGRIGQHRTTTTARMAWGREFLREVDPSTIITGLFRARASRHNLYLPVKNP